MNSYKLRGWFKGAAMMVQAFSFSIVFVGCGGVQTPNTRPKAAQPVTVLKQSRPAPQPPKPQVTVVQAEPSAVENEPKLTIIAPKNNQLVRKKDIQVKLQLKNWPLKAAPGNHIHLKLDNHREIALRDITKALSLREQMAQFAEAELEPGTHVLRAFVAHPGHESVKRKSAFDMIVFHYQEQSADFSFDPKAPLLTYSRPQGCSSDDRRLLDFYIANVDNFGEQGFRVRYTIDEDVQGIIVAWVPHWIDNLSDGEHSVRLELLNPDGTAALGPFNDVTRSFRVSEDCPAFALDSYNPSDEEDDDESAL